VAAKKKDCWRLRSRNCPDVVRREINSVEEKFIGPSDRLDRHVTRIGRDGTAHIDLSGQPPHHRAKKPIGRALTGGVKRANDRLRLEQQRSVRHTWCEWFVHVDHIETLIA
jgi:hypothetical protein